MDADHGEASALIGKLLFIGIHFDVNLAAELNAIRRKGDRLGFKRVDQGFKPRIPQTDLRGS